MDNKKDKLKVGQKAKDVKQSAKQIGYAKAKEFNKYAMEKGISPNFDSIRKADGYMAESDAMTKFYSNPDNVRKMKQGQKEYFSSKGKVLREPSDRGAQAKAPTKFIGAIGMTKGLLGGVRDVIQNKKAATAAGQDYSFKQGLGDFAVGGLNQVLGPNRAGTPTREFQQPNLEFPGQMSANQMEQFMKMFNMAQNMNAPTQMKSPNKLKYKK